MHLLMFSKMLKDVGNLSVSESGDRIAEMGFDGVDLTVRPGGHVLPENVIEALPKAVEILESKGLIVPMITTSITDSKERYAEEIFKAASQCGVKFLKLGYWMYEGFGKLKWQIDKVRSQLEGIFELCAKYDVTAGIHIHSGDYLSANPAILWMLLGDYDPNKLGAYIDPGHMAVEGGLSGWKIGMDLLQEKIRMVAVKDFGWFREIDDKTGQKTWVPRIVPLSEGLVPWQEVFGYLKKIGFDGPISIHSEYENVDIGTLISQTKKDLDYIRRILDKI